MSETEKERCADVNKALNKKAFEAAWNAYQNTPIDLIADSEDEVCRCVHNAIVAYLSAIATPTSSFVPEPHWLDSIGPIIQAPPEDYEHKIDPGWFADRGPVKKSP